MSLPMTVETLHAVPEAQRALYVEEEGKFHLDVEGRENWPKERAALETELQATRISERAATMERLAYALSRVGATPAGLDLLNYHFDKRIRIETVDGKRTVQILQADGAMPMVGRANDGTATFDDLAKEAHRQYPSLFQANVAAETGASPNYQRPSNGGKTMSRRDWDMLNPYEQAGKIKAGFTLFDEVDGVKKVPEPFRIAVGKTIPRKEFEALSPADRMAKMKDGFTLTE
jgi:hypothetical protein